MKIVRKKRSGAMSLVGSEVSISRIGNKKGDDSKEVHSRRGESHVDGTSLSEDSHHYSPTAASADDDENDFHRSLSPPRPAEELFMGSRLLEGHTAISATALAQQLHQHHLLDASSRGTLSVATDDFHSLVSRLSLRAGYNSHSSVATDDFQSTYSSEQQYLDFSDPALVSLDDSDDPFNNSKTSQSSVFERDALSRGDLYSSESPTQFHDTQEENNMTDTTTTKVDPAEKIYENAKGIWAWGKGVVVFKPFLGLAEGVAGKVVSMAGSSIEDVDSKVAEKLHGLDDSILNPAIAALVSTLMGAAHSTEDFVKPIIMTLLKPVDFLIKGKPENPEVTTPTTKPTTSTRLSA